MSARELSNDPVLSEVKMKVLLVFTFLLMVLVSSNYR